MNNGAWFRWAPWALNSGPILPTTMHSSKEKPKVSNEQIMAQMIYLQRLVEQHGAANAEKLERVETSLSNLDVTMNRVHSVVSSISKTIQQRRTLQFFLTISATIALLLILYLFTF